jgi:hypothetical protein
MEILRDSDKRGDQHRGEGEDDGSTLTNHD